MDGVVCRNMPAHEEAWRRFFCRHGIKIELQDFRANTMGMPTREVLRYYFKREVPPREAHEHAVAKETLYRKLSLPKRRAAAGLRDFLDASRDEGLRLGLGTGSKDDNVAFILDGLGLRGSFDAVVDGGMVTKGKPDPETFLLLAERLRVRPRDCVVFEDSVVGIQAARRAGMRAIGVTTAYGEEELRAAGAEVVIGNFEGLEWDSIARRL